jgi:hypothetical protein
MSPAQGRHAISRFDLLRRTTSGAGSLVGLSSGATSIAARETVNALPNTAISQLAISMTMPACGMFWPVCATTSPFTSSCCAGRSPLLMQQRALLARESNSLRRGQMIASGQASISPAAIFSLFISADSRNRSVP